MTETAWVILLALLLAGLIPLMPKLVGLRIRVLHGTGFHRLAKFHEDRFHTIVIAARIALAILVVALVVFAI